MAQRRTGEIPRYTSIPRPVGGPNSNVTHTQRIPERVTSSGLRPPNQSILRSSSVPRTFSSSSRPNATMESRSGGQIRVLRPPTASSTMRSSMDQSFIPKFTSSRLTAAPAQSNLTQRPAAGISRIPTPGSSETCPAVTKTMQSNKVKNVVRTSLLNQSVMNPGKKVTAKAKVTYQTQAENVVTPTGTEPLLQKAVLEKKVERDEQGEIITKNLGLSNLNEATGAMDNIQMGIQELGPRYPRAEGSEAIGVTSALSISPQHTTLTKNYIRSVTETNKAKIDISPQELAALIEEEKEDINNTLKMLPPDLLLEPGKYEIKRRLQQMRLNTESIALLEQSIIRPEVTADEVQEVLSPEAMAAMMYTVETGIKPESNPEQVFNSLFKETPNEEFINLSSVAPGPLQDVVVPTEVPKHIHKEALSYEMSKLVDVLENTNPENMPATDIFSRVMEEDKQHPEEGKANHRYFPLIQDERSLWVNANLEPLVNIVGAEPAEVLDPFNLDELEKSGNLENELMNGMEYLLDTSPVQYINRVQLRGSQLPSYFPGYLVAAPDFPEVVKIVKSPDEVFSIAWKSVQPKYFEEESTMSLLC